MANADPDRLRVVVDLEGSEVTVTLHASKAWKENFAASAPESRRAFAESTRDAAYKALTDALHALSFSGDTTQIRSTRS